MATEQLPWSESIMSAIKAVVDKLAADDIESIRLTEEDDACSPGDIREAIQQYGRTLLPLPLDAFCEMHLYPVDEASGGGWAADVPLWTAEEGRSDLEARLEFKAVDTGWSVRLHDVLVP